MTTLNETLLSAAQAATLTPEQLFAMDRSVATLQNSSVLIDDALKKALQVFAADTADEADPIVRELGILLMQASMGVDVDGNGVVDPVAAEGGLAALGGYVSLLSELLLYYSELTSSEQ